MLTYSLWQPLNFDLGEHSRPGCSSTRPRVEPSARAKKHRSPLVKLARPCRRRGRRRLRPGRARSPNQPQIASRHEDSATPTKTKTVQLENKTTGLMGFKFDS